MKITKMSAKTSMENINEYKLAILNHWFGQEENGDLIIKSKSFIEVYDLLAEYKNIDLEDNEQKQELILFIHDIVIKAFKGLEFNDEEWETIKKLVVDRGDVSLAKTVSVLVIGAVANVPLTVEKVQEINK